MLTEMMEHGISEHDV